MVLYITRERLDIAPCQDTCLTGTLNNIIAKEIILNETLIGFRQNKASAPRMIDARTHV